MGHIEIVKHLLAASADINANHEEGWSALKYAKESEHAKVIKILNDTGAKE